MTLGRFALSSFPVVKPRMLRGLADLTLAAMLLIAITAVPMFGQVSYYGTLRGLIHDPTGAVVPNANVTLVDEPRNLTRTTTSNTSGEYVFVDVTPSTYSVSVQAAGFKRIEQKGVVVDTQAQVTIDLTLQVGAVAQSIEVTAAAPTIETATASEGQALGTSNLTDLPNIGRNALINAKLAENVIFYGNPIMNRMQDQGSTANVSVAGSIGWVGGWLIDGIPETDWDGRPILIASIEGVDEVKVMTNTYDAEIARNGGFAVNTTLKSGTNEIHGAAYGAIRRNSMDANFFFNNAVPGTPIALPPQPNDNWAFNLGGPLVIPHLYNGRGKTFWFLAYEGYNNGTGYSSEFYNPTALEKNGDFSQTKANLAGDPLLLYDPTTTNLTTGARQTFLSEYGTNAIPQSMLNPVAVKTAAYFPAAQWAPRFYGDPDAASSTTSSSRGRQYVGKLDEQFTNWWRASFSQIKCWTVEPGPAWFGGPAAQSAWALWRLEDLTAINNTITINPTTVLSARYGFNRFPNQYFNIAAPNGFDPTSLGYPSSLVGQMQRPLMFPAINMTTAYSMGTATGNAYDWYSNNASATLSHVQGRHSLKTGFDYRRLVVNGLDYSDASGSYTFNGVFTQSNASSPAANTGADLADMLLGYPASGNLERTIKLQDYTNYFGAYVQDDIRLSSRLTINAGVRWEREPGFQEIQNRLYTNFDTDAVNPAANFMNPANTPPGFVPHGVIQWAGQNGAPYHVGNPEMNKIGPRLGVAYKLNNKTVLRGGAGLMWGPASVLGSPYSPAGFAAYTPYIASVNGNNTSAGSLSNPFPSGPLLPVGFAAGSFTGIGQGVSVWDPQSKAVRITQYSVDLQRELPGQMSLTVAFIGSNGANLPWDMNRNVLDPSYFSLGSSALGAAMPNPFYGVGNSPVAQGVIGTPTVPQYQLLLPFPTYSSVTFGQNPLNKSTYESGVVRLEKRMGQGLTLLTNLTWERSYDYNSSPSNLGSGAGSPQNPYNLAAERSLSQFSAPLLWNTAFTYQLPFGKGKSFLTNSTALDYIVGGWQLNGTGITRSGFPQQIQQTNFNGQYGYAVQRPNATGVPAATSGGLEARLNDYINPAAFSTVNATQFGNVGRMIPLRGPGWGGWDLSLFKTVPIYERFKAQFRLEALDAFNTPLFYGPNTNVSSGGFGTITSQANTGRQLQLCIRFMW